MKGYDALYRAVLASRRLYHRAPPPASVPHHFRQSRSGPGVRRHGLHLQGDLPSSYRHAPAPYRRSDLVLQPHPHVSPRRSPRLHWRCCRGALPPRRPHPSAALPSPHPAYPAVTITALAERLRIRHQSASCRVAHAVTRGLLRRRPDAVDRRLVLVSLTDAGARALDRVTHATQVESAAPQPATALIAATLPAAASSHIP